MATGLVPRIVVTKEDGRLATPSPKPLRKKESFCASLPDVSNAGLNAGLDEEQASKSDNETSTSGLSNRKVRKIIFQISFPTINVTELGVYRTPPLAGLSLFSVNKKQGSVLCVRLVEQ